MTPAKLIFTVIGIAVGLVVALFALLATLVFTGHANATVLVEDINRALALFAVAATGIGSVIHFAQMIFKPSKDGQTLVFDQPAQEAAIAASKPEPIEPVSPSV